MKAKQLARWTNTVQKYVEKGLTAKELAKYKLGSGRKVTAIPEGSDLDKSLKAFVEQMRGTKPFGGEDQHIPAELEQDGERLCICYEDLVGHVAWYHEDEYNTVEELNRELNWYHRVRNWCLRNGLSIRAVNRAAKKNVPKIGVSVRKARRRIAAAIRKRKLDRRRIGNLDEMAAQVFALWCQRTLHWRGSKSVMGPKGASSKLTLSIPVMWWANGDMELVVQAECLQFGVPVLRK